MSVHIDEVLEYLDAHPIGCYSGGVKSLMEMLYEVYCEYNDVNSDEIRDLMSRYYDLVDGYPMEDEERLYTLISELCGKHEVIAFAHGILVGMNLMAEVNGLP